MSWSKADVNGVYWWRHDKDSAPEPVEVRDGVFYCIADPDPTSTTLGEFLGPITPEQFTTAGQAFATFEQYTERHWVSAHFTAALADLRKAFNLRRRK